MQTGNLETIVAWVSILGVVLATFGYLLREMRRGFDRIDQRFLAVDDKFGQMDNKLEEKFDRVDDKFDERLIRLENKFDNRLIQLEGKFDNRLTHLGGKFDNRLTHLEDKFDKKFELVTEEIKGLTKEMASVRVRVARIEGHLGIGIAVSEEPQPPDPARESATGDPAILRPRRSPSRLAAPVEEGAGD